MARPVETEGVSTRPLTQEEIKAGTSLYSELARIQSAYDAARAKGVVYNKATEEAISGLKSDIQAFNVAIQQPAQQKNRTETSRTPIKDAYGKIVGYTVFYSDGSQGYEPNPDYTKQSEITLESNPAYQTIEGILKQYNITGIASVIEQIRKEYPKASSEDIMTLLQYDSRYNAKFNERFSANAERAKNGYTILDPSTYLQLEQGYRKAFESYGLSRFNNQTQFNNLIARNKAVTEVNQILTMAFDRVLGDEQVKTAFKTYYPSLSAQDIVAGMISEDQLPVLERKVRTAEIGGAALRQGLSVSAQAGGLEQTTGYSNVTRATMGAEQLAAQGVTKAQAEQAYSQIASALPTAEKLSSIYGKTTEQYGLLQGEQEFLGGLASAKRARQKIVEAELASFEKRSGGARGFLTGRSAGGQI